MPGQINRREEANRRIRNRVRWWMAAVVVLVGPSAIGVPGAIAGQTEQSATGPAPSMADMRRRVGAATGHAADWPGPSSGPVAQTGKTIAVMCEDLRNGGILGVAQGIQEAARVIGWEVKLFDAGGTATGRERVIAYALASNPDGALLVGSDAQALRSQLALFGKRRIPLVGWHVASKVGAIGEGPVAMNVSTDPIEVARVTAMAAVVAAKGKAGVVIFTDSNFEIALAKSNAMAEVIRACQQCELLEVRDLAISRSAELMPAETRALLAKYGRRWTHALAINDIYFDYAVPEFTQAGLSSDAVSLLSAGDGSMAAFLRIQAGIFQSATAAEPLNLHGWQMVDELNRLLAAQPVSGYVFPVHLVMKANLVYDGGPVFAYDPDFAYRRIYRRIWRK